MRRDSFRSHSFLSQFLFSWMIPRRLSVACGKSAPPAPTAAIAPAAKSRRSRRVQRRKSWGATSISCGGRSWRKLAGFRADTGSVEDVWSGSPAEALSSGFIFKSPQILRPRRPTYDHAAKRVPAVSENENHVRYNKENKNPH